MSMSFNSSTSDLSNQQNRSGSGWKVFLLPGILVCAMIIFAAARGDLWLDEIWSIFISEAAKSPWDIVSLFKHDNNHLLNTFYLYLIGKQNHLVVYRLFSIAAGIGSLFLLTAMASTWGYLERIFVLLFAGFSYPLILYFSEARGYAPAIFFALSSLFVLEKCLTNYSTIKLLLFWLCSCLGTLSHLSYIIAFLSLSIFVIYNEFSGSSSLKSKLQNSFKYLLIPSVFIISFYLYYAKDMTIGGGDVNDPFKEISRGIAYLLGLPHGSIPWRVAAFGLFMSMALIGAYLYQKEGNRVWSFVIPILVLPPVVIIFVLRPTIYYFRYLVVTFPFFYLLLSSLLGRLYRSSGKYSYIPLIILCVYFIGQTQYLLPLLRDGRGNYQAILREISEKSEGNDLKVGSDHDFRNRMLLSFYQRFLPSQQTLQYIEQSRWNVEPPEWIITHSTSASFEPDPFISISVYRVYKLARSERFSGNSGFCWSLYHRIDPGLTPGRNP